MYDSKRIIAHPADGVALKERAAGRAKITARFCPGGNRAGGAVARLIWKRRIGGQPRPSSNVGPW
jgi:hypothetical protein